MIMVNEFMEVRPGPTTALALLSCMQEKRLLKRGARRPFWGRE